MLLFAPLEKIPLPAKIVAEYVPEFSIKIPYNIVGLYSFFVTLDVSTLFGRQQQRHPVGKMSSPGSA